MRSLPNLLGLARSLTIAVLLVSVQVMGIPGMAAAAPPVAYAGLVIDYGNDAVTYALVPVPSVEISGTELLHSSGIDVVSVSFGGLGEGVCRIQRVGCDPGPCRARLCQTSDPRSPFWHYVQAAPVGSWQAAPLGASASHVQAGSVDGWFWSSDAPTTTAPSLSEIAQHLNVNLEEDSGPGQGKPVVATVGAIASDMPSASRSNALAAGAVLLLVALAGLTLASRRGMHGTWKPR